MKHNNIIQSLLPAIDSIPNIQKRVLLLLKQRLDILNPAVKLHQALCHSALAPAKYIRSCWIYTIGQHFNAPIATLDTLAVAAECIHTFSLIHDDLPAMDDDDMRRGRSSCHVAFDEATAILAGDSLQSLAFSMLSEKQTEIDLEKQIQIIHTFAQSIGLFGMAAGQSLDMQGSDSCSVEELEKIHLYKTAKLIQACIECAFIASEQYSTSALESIQNYGKHIGLAFQINDDLLDISLSDGQLGKPSYSDIKNQKATYPAILGYNGAIDQLESHLLLAQEAIGPFNIPSLDAVHQLMGLSHTLERHIKN